MLIDLCPKHKKVSYKMDARTQDVPRAHHMCQTHHDMEMLSSLLALWEGNPPVTGGFPSHRASNADVFFFFVASLNKLLNNQLSGVLRQQHVMSLQQVTLNVANGKLVECAGSVGTQYSMVSYHVIMWSLWHYNDVIMSMMAS